MLLWLWKDLSQIQQYNRISYQIQAKVFKNTRIYMLLWLTQNKFVPNTKKNYSWRHCLSVFYLPIFKKSVLFRHNYLVCIFIQHNHLLLQCLFFWRPGKKIRVVRLWELGRATHFSLFFATSNAAVCRLALHFQGWSRFQGLFFSSKCTQLFFFAFSPVAVDIGHKIK